MMIPQGPSHRWLLDFVSGVLSDGRRLRFLRIIADFSQDCLASVLDTSTPGIRGEQVRRSCRPNRASDVE
ncbi:MAG: hypothetical protein CMN19_09435 [Roseovarius sp.]|nr:hypothetical protein [Roseovarius sp.]